MFNLFTSEEVCFQLNLDRKQLKRYILDGFLNVYGHLIIRGLRPNGCKRLFCKTEIEQIRPILDSRRNSVGRRIKDRIKYELRARNNKNNTTKVLISESEILKSQQLPKHIRPIGILSDGDKVYIKSALERDVAEISRRRYLNSLISIKDIHKITGRSCDDITRIMEKCDIKPILIRNGIYYPKTVVRKKIEIKNCDKNDCELLDERFKLVHPDKLVNFLTALGDVSIENTTTKKSKPVVKLEAEVQHVPEPIKPPEIKPPEIKQIEFKPRVSRDEIQPHLDKMKSLIWQLHRYIIYVDNIIGNL